MRTRSVRPALLVVLLAGFAVRVYRLGAQELRGDESFGYFFSLRPYSEIVRATIELGEPHPVGSYFLQRAWLTLLGQTGAGHSEVSLRIAGVCFGVLAPALIYRLGRSLSLAGISALLAALLASVSPYLVWHAQDARMYSMSVALTLAATVAMVEWLRAKTKRAEWSWALAYIMVGLLALHTHYFAAFVLVVHYVFVVGQGILDRRYRWSILPWTAIQAVVGLLYLPWLFVAAETLLDYRGNGSSPNLREGLFSALAAMGGNEALIGRPQTLAAAATLVLLVIGAYRLYRQGGTSSQAATLLLLYLFLPLAATWFSARQRPIFDPRYLAAAAPPLYLLSAAAVGEVASTGWSRRQALQLTSVTLFVLLLIGSAAGLNRQFHDPTHSKTRGWRELAAAVERLSGGMPADEVRIVQNFPDPTLWFYYPGTVEHIVLPPAPNDASGAADALAKLRDEGVRHIIIPYQPASNWDAGGIAEQALADAGFQHVWQEQIGVWPVAYYTDITNPKMEQVNNTVFSSEIALAGVAGLDVVLVPGGILVPVLLWDIEETGLEAEYKVSLQLLGPGGELIAQDDRPLDAQAGAFVRSYGVPLPDVLLPGNYVLNAVLYDPETGTRALLGGGGDYVSLGSWRHGERMPD